MNIKLVSLCLVFSSICYGQESWFKHLQGWQARNSIIQGDTILTCGMDYKEKSFGKKYDFNLYWTKLNGDSLGILKINLDSIESDSFRSTTISYNFNSLAFNEGKWYYFLNLSYGAKKSRAFLLTFDKFFSEKFKIKEYQADTFPTFINNLIFINKSKIIITPYLVTKSHIESYLNTKIFKENNDVKSELIEFTSRDGLRFETYSHVPNKVDRSSFIFILNENYNNSWQNYIVNMDTTGNILWKVNPNNRDSIISDGMQFIQKANGNLLVSWIDLFYKPNKNPQGHQTLYQINDSASIWFAEINYTGEILWRKKIRKYLLINTGSNYLDLRHTNARLNNDVNVFWTGNRYDINKKKYVGYLLKTDINGNPDWFRDYDLYPNNKARNDLNIYDLELIDNGLLLTGEYFSTPGNIFPNGCQLATIIKVNKLGCLIPDCDKNDGNGQIKRIQFQHKAFPNPCNQKINLDFKNNDLYKIQVFDLKGIVIKEYIGSNEICIDTKDILNGFYYLKVLKLNNEIVEIIKICVQH